MRLLRETKKGCFGEAKGRSPLAVSPRESVQLALVQRLTQALPALIAPARSCSDPMGVQCREPLGEAVLPCGRARYCQSPSELEQAGLRVAAACVPRMIEHRHPSVVSGSLSSLPVLHLHAHHLLFGTSLSIILTGVPPIYFPATLLSTLVLSSADFFQHLG